MLRLKNITIILITVLMTQMLLAQTTESLTLAWEPSVYYGTYSQRTVVVNDTLWHFGGLLRYGIPFGYDFRDGSFMEFKGPGNDFWNIDTTKIIYRRYFNAETYNGKIYIMGGISQIDFEFYYPEEVEIFDPSLRRISYGSPLPYPHRAGGSVEVNGQIYLIGGGDTDNYTDRVDIYDINSDTWSEGAPLPIAMETEAAYYLGKIYAVGGYNGVAHNEMLEYDIASNTWTLVGNTPEPVSAHKVEVYNGQLFVLGDFAVLDRIWKYDIGANSWISYESNIIGRRHTSTAISGDKLYIIAGNSRLDGVYQYYNVVQSIDLSGYVGVQSKEVIPLGFEIEQNYPNPFNSSTTIRYRLSETSLISLSIVDVAGREIRELARGEESPGTHVIQWDCKTELGNLVPSGEYFVTIKTDTGTLSRKSILLK